MIRDEVNKLRERIAAHKGGLQAFAKANGLSYSWLYKFQNGALDNPRLSSLEKLESALKR